MQFAYSIFSNIVYYKNYKVGPIHQHTKCVVSDCCGGTSDAIKMVISTNDILTRRYPMCALALDELMIDITDSEDESDERSSLSTMRARSVSGLAPVSYRSLKDLGSSSGHPVFYNK